MNKISELKNQVQKIAHLQDELLKLQSSLDEAKFEKGKLEELLKLLSEECEELKVQKVMLSGKVSHTQDTSKDVNEEKRSKTAMQAKAVNSQQCKTGEPFKILKHTHLVCRSIFFNNT